MVNKRDPRLGHETEWPKTAMGGGAYTRPATTITLGNGYFCVVDTFLKANERDTLLEELKALVAAPSKRAVKAVVKPDKDDDDDKV